METHPIRVYIIAIDPLARAGLVSLFDAKTDFNLVGSSSLEDTTDDLLSLYRPDVIIWDVGWEQASANFVDQGMMTEKMSEIVQRSIPILALVSDVHLAFDAWNAGVLGILDRGGNELELMAAVYAIHQGLTVLKGNFRSQFLPSDTGTDPYNIEPLTQRELEVLQLVSEGISNKAIAVRLSVSEHTIKFHINTIFRKLDAQSRTEAVVRAYRLGLIFF